SLTLLLCASTYAIDVDPKLDKAVRDAVPVCSDLTLTYDELPMKLPQRFTGTVVNMKSKRGACEGALVAVLSPTGGFFMGAPWLIEGEEGATTEDKLKAFIWRNMQENMTATIDRTKRTDDGLYRATLTQITENGKMPLDGELDPSGRVFFFGHFRRLKDDIRAQRAKAFDAFIPNLPAKGAAAGAPVTVVEFSDFQCPSCKRSSGYADALLAKHGDKVRYIRFDLPLTMHPWAFPAALAGRAIYRQKPELFWEYKKQVYANQENLNAFAFWDWARGWAEDHELDMKKFDADTASEDIKSEILRGAGTAFSNEVRATPTFMINGAMVDAGDEGKALNDYIESLLK
ncbi:MAG TPA: thioredoxin domain-containing protein, partial [Thermoanaerobaculia bacterium]|nr:thioredoxin domain-containing protein [Thermoanaerobaculia bacterium]